MISKSKRIHAKEFATIPKGIIRNTPYFDVKISEGNSLKIACVVKTKTFKKAVLRNKARRRMYALAQELLENKKGFYIFYPKPQFLTTPYIILKKTLLSLQ